MPVALLLRMLVVAALVALVLVAYFDPSALALFRNRASHNALWLAIGLIAAACGAKLTLAVPVFGAKAHITAPLLLTLAAPYLLRATGFKVSALKPILHLRAKIGGDRGRASQSKRAVNSDVPGALPARVATALEAAARARR